MESFITVLATVYKSMQAPNAELSCTAAKGMSSLENLSLPNQDVLLCKFRVAVLFLLLNSERVLIE